MIGRLRYLVTFRVPESFFFKSFVSKSLYSRVFEISGNLEPGNLETRIPWIRRQNSKTTELNKNKKLIPKKNYVLKMLKQLKLKKFQSIFQLFQNVNSFFFQLIHFKLVFKFVTIQKF